VRHFKAALATLHRAGEGAFLVAKQFRGDQGGRNRRTVYADERLAGTLRVLVYGASNQFFPVPVSPVISAVESVGATFTMLESTVCRAGDAPTISSNMNA
jgi:hypothetical protein